MFKTLKEFLVFIMLVGSAKAELVPIEDGNLRNSQAQGVGFLLEGDFQIEELIWAPTQPDKGASDTLSSLEIQNLSVQGASIETTLKGLKEGLFLRKHTQLKHVEIDQVMISDDEPEHVILQGISIQNLDVISETTLRGLSNI